ILSRKMKIADFRLTFSKKEFQNGAICKSFSVISTFTTYRPYPTARKALAPRPTLKRLQAFTHFSNIWPKSGLQ
ncbi:MAG: hypothetical protein IKG93_10895, partial [Clostridiales bacterium]|nr:hypothetical protein [Clostridiales bacterium]